MEYSVRAARVEDCKDIRRLVGELAEYENVADEVTITQRGVRPFLLRSRTMIGKHRDLERDGFSENPLFHCIIAEVPEQHKTRGGHTKIGYTTYFFNYHTWIGRAVYMGDLYVSPEFRGKGIGRALMSKVAQAGLAAGCHQLNFAIMDWNKSAQGFYLRQGCVDITASTGKHFMRCEGEALEHLAQP